MKNNKGISLIVLVITIIIVIILAAAVVLTLNKNNPLESAKEARFKEDVRNFQHELDIMHSNNYITNQDYESSEIKASGYNEMKVYIPDITKEYTDLLDIREGKLVYIIKSGNTEPIEKKWSEDLNIIYNPTWDDIIKDANNNPNKYKHPNATGDGIGIGTDKEPVNMDLWTYSKLSNGTYQLGFQYKGKVVDGKIEGCIPQYIYDPKDNILKPVTVLNMTFNGVLITVAPVIPDTVTSIDNNAFAITRIKTIDIPNTVTYIGFQAFQSSTIEEIIMPDSITSMGSYAFNSCKKLKKVVMSNNINSIGIATFYDCTSLTDIKLSNSLNSIGTLSFRGCTSIESIIIPSSTTKISSDSFQNCNNLKNIYVKKPENSIGSSPWGATNATIKWNWKEE